MVEAAEVAVSKRKPTQGFKTLHDENLDDLSYEQIIVDHPEEFSPRALWYARRTLGLPNETDKPPSRASIPVQIRTEELIAWLRSGAVTGNGSLGSFSNADAALAIGISDMQRSGRVFGNIQSRSDFACYKLGLPPLGLAADRPFDDAWRQEERIWAFPVDAMQRTTRAFRWQGHDFEQLISATGELPGQAHLLWKQEPSMNEAGVEAWAEGLEHGPQELPEPASPGPGGQRNPDWLHQPRPPREKSTAERRPRDISGGWRRSPPQMRLSRNHGSIRPSKTARNRAIYSIAGKHLKIFNVNGL